MYLLERDLEEIIFNTELNDLRKKGLPLNGKLLRQVKIGNYGIADLISVYRDNYPLISTPEKIVGIPTLCIDIIELKKDNISISAFLQAIGYMKGIKQYLEYRAFNNPVEFKIILIGKEISEFSTFRYLPELLPPANEFEKDFLEIYTYDYDINGVRFNLIPYCNIENNGF